MIITIDGPSATGKSTISKKIAEALHFIHFDTGAMYRCFTYDVIRAKISPDDHAAILELLKNFKIDIRQEKGVKRYFVHGVDVTDAIRSQEITDLVSKIAAYPEVRHELVKLQRAWAKGVDVVFEGRDLGTVVFPDAHYKFFLTGRDEIRAKRRYSELLEKYPEEAKKTTLSKVQEDLVERDHLDSTRKCSPLKPASEAHIIDTSDLTIDQVIQNILKFVRK